MRNSFHLGGPRRSSIISARKIMDEEKRRNSKSEKEAKIKIISEFLTEHDFPEENVPNKPSANYVKNVFAFIFKKFIPKFSTFKNYENDVGMYLDVLGCPFKISKSHLQAPGSPNSWASIMIVFVWLIEEYEYGIKSVSTGIYNGEDAIGWLENITDEYEKFLEGVEIEEIIQNIRNKYSVKKRYIGIQIEDENDEVNSLEKKIEKLKEEPNVAELERQHEKLKEDLEKFKELELKKLEHISSIKKKCGKYDEAYNSLKAKQKEFDLQIGFAEHKLKNQLLSKEDLERIKSRKKTYIAELGSLQERNSKGRKIMEEKEIARIKNRQEVDDAADELNRLLKEVNVVPRKARFAYENDFSLSVNHDAPIKLDEEFSRSIRKMTSVDLKKTLKGHLNKIFEIFTEKRAGLLNECMRVETFLREMHSDYRRLEKEKDQAFNDLEKLKTLNEARINKLESEKEKLSDKLHRKQLELFKVTKNDDESYDDLVSKYKEIMQRITMKKEKREKIRNEKIELIKLAMGKFMRFRKLRVEEFKELEKLTRKISLIFPKMD